MAKVQLDSSRKTLVQAICEKFPAYFQEVDPERIIYLMSGAKMAKKPINIAPVKTPYDLVVRHKFILTFYDKKLEDLNGPKTNLYLLRELMRIGDFEDGTLIGYPVQDFPEILAKFGVDWEDREDVPDVLTMEDEEKKEASPASEGEGEQVAKETEETDSGAQEAEPANIETT